MSRRQSEIEEKLDLTKNQASNQLDATESNEINTNGERPDEHPLKKIERGSKRGFRV